MRRNETKWNERGCLFSSGRPQGWEIAVDVKMIPNSSAGFSPKAVMDAPIPFTSAHTLRRIRRRRRSLCVRGSNLKSRCCGSPSRGPDSLFLP